jgi:molybdopterin-guanine dinucleotide biosynthesis protein A
MLLLKKALASNSADVHHPWSNGLPVVVLALHYCLGELLEYLHSQKESMSENFEQQIAQTTSFSLVKQMQRHS